MSASKWQYFRFLIIHCCIFFSYAGFAQCPPNIGFESGSFANWECSTGVISQANGSITMNSPGTPVSGRHTLIANTAYTSLDFYGLFPMSCPNGSGYSIQLGNSGTGKQVDRVSYTFTIPPDQNSYSIIYNYAVVFQNPGHAEWEQPKFTANVFDVTNDSYIGCSSFSYAASANLPGFKESTQKDSIFYKPWTPVTIKLSGYAGRTIRLEFTTNDCSRGGHFGYAYVDVNDDCSSPISGNVYCKNDNGLTLTAPFGFAGYRWFNDDFSKVLSTKLTLQLTPAPAAGTVFGVEVTPYPEQGCIDTVYSTIRFVNDIVDLQVPVSTLFACASNIIDLTSNKLTNGSAAGLKFAYFTDASQTTFVPIPKSVSTSGTYYIKATNNSGCNAVKPITIKFVNYPVFTTPDPPDVIRPEFIDLNTTIVGEKVGITFTFWKDKLATLPLLNPDKIIKTGTYYVKGANQTGCSIITSVNVIVKEPPIVPPNAFSPNGDGVHDTWEIPILSIFPDCTVEIFNRLGQLLYRSVAYKKSWDGKYMGYDMPVATYYYVIKASPELPPIGGSVTIIR